MNKEILWAYRKNRIGLIVSVAVHAGFLSVLMLFSSWTPPNIQTFHLRFEQTASAEPAVRATAPVHKTARPKIQQPQTQTPPAQPVAPQEILPAQKQPMPEPAPSAAPAQTVETFQPAPPAVAPVTTAAPEPANPGVVDTSFGEGDAPRFLHRECPVYPHRARVLEREGKVVLKLFIDATGKLVDVTVVEAAAYGFTEAAVKAVKKSTFAPARRNGHRVASRAIVAIRFRLESE